jgi:superfamily II DNA or RNA helicase
MFAQDAFEARPLRDHQRLAMSLLRNSYLAGHRRTVLELPTGAGKTRIAAEIVNGALIRGKRVCFTVPAISLVDQTLEAFQNEGIYDLGVLQANHPRTHYGAAVQIASVQTIARRFIPEADIVVVDECHLRFDVIRNWMRDCPDTLFIGLSATPWARGMAEQWDDLVIPVRMQELIGAGYLSPFRVFAPSHPDLSSVKTVKGDYDEGQLAEVMGESRLVADVVDTWLRRGRGRPTLVFAVNLAHARQIQEKFAAAGIAMGYCDARVDLIERKLLFDRLARGEIAGIVNVGTLTTGVDADIRCIVMARPTKSEMLFVQCIGRGLRTAPGKDDCLILDHADNHARLGFVTDIRHDRLLGKGDKRPATRKERNEPMPRECNGCGVLKPPMVSVCPSCGFKPERQCDIEAEEGELVEWKPGRKRFTRVEKQEFWSMALFVDRERQKGRKFAKALYRAKFGVWPVDLIHIEKKPTPEFKSYEKSRRIAYAAGLKVSPSARRTAS